MRCQWYLNVKDGNAPVHIAAGMNSKHSVILLLSYGAEINKRNNVSNSRMFLKFICYLIHSNVVYWMVM